MTMMSLIPFNLQHNILASGESRVIGKLINKTKLAGTIEKMQVNKQYQLYDSRGVREEGMSHNGTYWNHKNAHR